MYTVHGAFIQKMFVHRGGDSCAYSLLLLAGGGWGGDGVLCFKMHYEALRREVVD